MSSDIVGRGFTFPLQLDKRGGFSLTNERNEIEQAMRIIVMTVQGTRVMRPEFGCRIHELVFAPNNATTHARARRYVIDALKMWEPRATVQDVTVYADSDYDNRMIIEVTFRVKATNDERSLVHPFYLIPEE
jgi:hypothetical protein